MKTLILILVVATTGLAVASVQFYRQASVQREHAEAERALRQKQDARIHELEQAQANLQQQLVEAQQSRMTDARVAETIVPTTPGLGGIGSRLERVERKDATGATFAAVPRPFRGPMQSEAGQRFMRTQMRGSMRRLYQDVGRELDLTQEQADKLIELMADQQTRVFADRRQPVSYKDLQEQNNKDVAALIGESKMAEWKAYQQSLPQRSQVDSMGQQLENAGVPLSGDQRSQLIAALVDEAQANPRPTPTAGLAPEEAMKQYNEWQDAYDKSVADRAKQVLNSEQYERYHEYTEWMAEMRKNLPTPGGQRAFRLNGGGVAAGSSSFQWTAPPANSVLIAPAPAPAPRE